MAGSSLLLVIALRIRRIRMRRVLPALGFSLAVLLVLTAVFDNVMIASGLFDYGQQTLLGPRVGLAPIEDFSYPVSVVFFAPALWWLVGGRHPDGSVRGLPVDGNYMRDQ
ncbi:MAG: lycopene cyclase domain-containing protein [Acidobacteria bacterium]|nr:lycopene cyclase domain-containing protein [Acidobacteriota bacterium]